MKEIISMKVHKIFNVNLHLLLETKKLDRAELQ